MRQKLLVMLLKGQMEQLSNALALQQPGYGDVMQDFDDESLQIWLVNPPRDQGLIRMWPDLSSTG